MIWSFSRLNGFYGCKRAWYITYILNKFYKKEYKMQLPSIQKFFALYGTFAHSIFEKYNNGELELFELYDYCNDNFSAEISVQAPPNRYVDLYQSYRTKLLDYLKIYEGNKSKILCAEKEININIPLLLNKEIKFTGFIDLVLQDDDGEIILQDYKSRSDFKSQQELKEYWRQLLLYSEGVFPTYEKYPKKLVFDMFKINKIVETPFKKEDLDESIEWVDNTITNIKNECIFERMTNKPKDNFFCRYVCNFGTDICDAINLNEEEDLLTKIKEENESLKVEDII